MEFNTDRNTEEVENIAAAKMMLGKDSIFIWLQN